MRSPGLLGKLLSLSVLCFVLAGASRANSVVVRGGSTYGDNTGFTSCVANIATFTGGGSASNCEGFVAATFDIGGTDFTGVKFAFLEPGGSGFGVIDIISLAAGSSLTIPLVNPALPTGVFACGSFGTDASVASDSTPNPMTGLPCTPGSSPSTGYSGTEDLAGISATFSSSGVTFDNASTGAIALFTADGNIAGSTVAAPEPASIVLLGFGMFALGRRFRRPA